MAFKIFETSEQQKLRDSGVLIPAINTSRIETTKYYCHGRIFETDGDVLILGPASANWRLLNFSLTMGAEVDLDADDHYWTLNLELYKMDKYKRYSDYLEDDEMSKNIIEMPDQILINQDLNAITRYDFPMNISTQSTTLHDYLYREVANYGGSNKYGYALKDGITEDDAEDSEFLLGLKIDGYIPNFNGYDEYTQTVFKITHTSNTDLHSESMLVGHRQERYR
jgi:hypothetical protein